jgi:hypothetical protein
MTLPHFLKYSHLLVLADLTFLVAPRFTIHYSSTRRVSSVKGDNISIRLRRFAAQAVRLCQTEQSDPAE